MTSLIVQLLAVLLLPSISFAQLEDPVPQPTEPPGEPSGEIREVDSGACWAQSNSDQTAWKIASFNDNANFYVLRDNQIPSEEHKLQAKLSEKLKAYFPNFAASPIKIHLHCSGAGHQLLITVENAKSPLCVWAKKASDSNVSLDIHSVLPNPVPTNGSACYGVSPASFLFVVKDGVDPTLLAKHLSKKYRSSIKTLKTSTVLGYVHVQLKERFAFKERELRAFFLSDAKIAEKIRTIEYDGAVLTTGEELKLLESNYSGF